MDPVTVILALLAVIVMIIVCRLCGNKAIDLINVIRPGTVDTTKANRETLTGVCLFLLLALAIVTEWWVGLLIFLGLCVLPLWTIYGTIYNDDLAFIKKIGFVTGMPIATPVAMLIVLFIFNINNARAWLRPTILPFILTGTSLAIYREPMFFANLVIRIKNAIRKGGGLDNEQA